MQPPYHRPAISELPQSILVKENRCCNGLPVGLAARLGRSCRRPEAPRRGEGHLIWNLVQLTGWEYPVLTATGKPGNGTGSRSCSSGLDFSPVWHERQSLATPYTTPR